MSNVPRETAERIDRLISLVREEGERQNLVAKSTFDDLRSRHIDDSFQLIDHAQPGCWLDIGSGAGFPGLVVAIADPSRPVILVEPRRLRAEFLQRAADDLGLSEVKVMTAKIESVAPLAVDIISARAVANLARLFEMAEAHAAPGCRWLLPKGRSAAEELAVARRTWQGRFTLIPSITDPEASIVMAEDVTRRRAR